MEVKYRANTSHERMPFAINTPMQTVITDIVPDSTLRPGETETDKLKHPIYLIVSQHHSTLGIRNLLNKIFEYLKTEQKKHKMDILSISGTLQDSRLYAVVFVRVYDKWAPQESVYMTAINGERRAVSDNRPVVPTEMAKPILYSQKEKEDHKELVEKQTRALLSASEEQPFLNTIGSYTRRELPKYDESTPLTYSLMARDRRTPTLSSYEEFTDVFQQMMIHTSTIEATAYENVLKGDAPKTAFLEYLRTYAFNTYVTERKKLPEEDMPVLMAKLDRSLFALYIIQDLIDDERITDIKIVSPDAVRVRIRGRAYLSDICFVDGTDYLRFIRMLCIRNNIDIDVPTQTFTDESDPNYIIRFTLTAPYITANKYPILHIRKVTRRKMMSDDLIAAGMYDAKIRDYLLDCGKTSSGVVFAGPPGSGKTILLNWFLEEAYEDSAEILVIQENDELFSYRKGIMFQHVVNNPPRGQRGCSLEDLGQMALVAGANVFVIGEVKGGEICSAATLANSGCRTALTLHSSSSTETINKMADLAMRGTIKSYDIAKRMMKCFTTIVYVDDFKIREISEIVGFDEDKKDMIYRAIYRRPASEND